MVHDNGAPSKTPEEIARFYKQLAIVRSGAERMQWVVSKVAGNDTVRLKSKGRDTLLRADGVVKTTRGRLEVYTGQGGGCGERVCGAEDGGEG